MEKNSVSMVGNVFLPAHESIIKTIREATGSDLRIVAFNIRNTKYPPATISDIMVAWQTRLSELKAKGGGWVIKDDDFEVADSLALQLETAAAKAAEKAKQEVSGQSQRDFISEARGLSFNEL